MGLEDFSTAHHWRPLAEYTLGMRASLPAPRGMPAFTASHALYISVRCLAPPPLPLSFLGRGLARTPVACVAPPVAQGPHGRAQPNTHGLTILFE